jgi:hypothetical protein
MQGFIAITPTREAFTPRTRAPALFGIRDLKGKLRALIRLRSDLLAELGWQVGDTMLPAIDPINKRLFISKAPEGTIGYKLVEDNSGGEGGALHFPVRSGLGLPMEALRSVSVPFEPAEEGLLLNLAAV